MYRNNAGWIVITMCTKGIVHVEFAGKGFNKVFYFSIIPVSGNFLQTNNFRIDTSKMVCKRINMSRGSAKNIFIPWILTCVKSKLNVQADDYYCTIGSTAVNNILKIGATLSIIRLIILTSE